MKRTLLAAILATAAIAFSCTETEEPDNLGGDSLISNPTATIEDFVLDGASTKTTFSIVDGKALFSFNDDDILRIWPAPDVNKYGYPFEVKDNSGSSCQFYAKGFRLEETGTYSAFYPGFYHGKNIDFASNAVTVDYVGQAQNAIGEVDYLYATGIKPKDGGCAFTMKHLGVLLPIAVTFDEAGTFTELSLTSNKAKFITKGIVDLTKDPVAITPDEENETVSLTLGEEVSTRAGANSISVEAGSTVTFYMMIAPVNMDGSTITVDLKNGNDVIFSSEIAGKDYKAGMAYKMSVESEEPLGDPIDLSAKETANSYIVSEAGYYSINATVAGNGEKKKPTLDKSIANSTTDPAYPTYNTTRGFTFSEFAGADGVTVTLNQNNCVSDVSYESGKILFKATGNKGNAKLTLTSGGEYIWTWVIWCTDAPSVHTLYNDGIIYHLMDRNLGATSDGSVLPNSIEEVAGLYYQFGNPIGYTWEEFENGLAEENRSQAATMKWSLAESPNRPNLNVTGTPAAVGATADWYWFWVYSSSGANALMGKLWGGGSNFDESLKCGFETSKTIYDPCPAGYKVMGYDTFSDYDDVDSGNAFGFYVPVDDGNLFIPYNGLAFSTDFGYYWQGRGPYPITIDGVTGPFASLWTSGAPARNMGFNFVWKYNNGSAVVTSEGSPDGAHIVARGMGVRCIEDEDFSDYL